MTASQQLQGSLATTSLDRILDACKRSLITGVITVSDSHRRIGRIEVRAGVVDRSELDNVSGPAALIMMKEFAGDFVVEQALPDLTGALGGSALAEGAFSGVSFTRLMRHCEDHALTCVVTVDNEGDHVEVEYRAGEIKRITRNGKPDEDVIVEVVHWEKAHFKVIAPPLELDVGPTPEEKAAAEKAAAEKAAAEQAAAEKAAAAKAAAEKAAAEKAAAEKAAAEKAAAEKAAAEKAAAEKAAAEKAAAEKAAAEKAAAEKAAAEKKKAEEEKAAAEKAAAEKKKAEEEKAAAEKAAAEKKKAEEEKAAAEKKKAEEKKAEEKKKPAADDKKKVASDDKKKKPAAEEKKPEEKKAGDKKKKLEAETTLEIDRPGRKASKADKQPDKQPAARAATNSRATTAGNDRDTLWMFLAVLLLAAAFGAVVWFVF
jgi:hypothetical protein